MTKDKIKLTEVETGSGEIACCIAIQKIGRASPKEIMQKLEEWDLKATLKQVEKHCTNLQKKGLVSTNYEMKEGIRETCYSMAKAIFKRDIPIAHYKDIVDVKNSDEGKLFIDLLDAGKGVDKGRMPDHCKYFNCKVVWKIVDGVYGFMEQEDDIKRHYRFDNKIVFHPRHFKAYLGRNFRLDNKTESLKHYFGFDYGSIELNGEPIRIEQFPVLDGRQGRGFAKYEVLPRGTKIETTFSVPSTDFEPKEFEAFLKRIGRTPICGFGGRGSQGAGRLDLIDFKISE